MAIDKQFTRTEILLGSDKLNALMNKHVLIAGLGGVGGYVVENIVRAGVGEITLIDFDTIDITNLNRQLITTHDNVGKLKIEEVAKRMIQINPSLKINVLPVFLDESNIPEIIEKYNANYIIDCIDTVSSKLFLIKYCLYHKLKIISSMGAGNRIDVTKVHIADISKTKSCGLAKSIRLKLRKDRIHKGLKVIYSSEEMYSPPKINEKGVRPTNGTISYLPALFGVLLSGVVIKELLM